MASWMLPENADVLLAIWVASVVVLVIAYVVVELLRPSPGAVSATVEFHRRDEPLAFRHLVARRDREGRAATRAKLSRGNWSRFAETRPAFRAVRGGRTRE
jgi:hypothetical protein